MESYQERVVEELVALNYRIIALRDFLPSECFASLDQDEQFRLMEQLYHMQEYGKILQERVNAWLAVQPAVKLKVEYIYAVPNN